MESKDTSVSQQDAESPPKTALNRRSFLCAFSAGAAALFAAPTAVAFGDEFVQPTRRTSLKLTARNSMAKRRAQVVRFRQKLTNKMLKRRNVEHTSNGEEQDYPFLCNFSKGLPHDNLGHVDATEYESMLRALASGQFLEMEKVRLAGDRQLKNPHAGLAMDLEGSDSHEFAIPPAPRIDSAHGAGEGVELYWMALARDVPFVNYDSDPVIERAAAELSRLSDYRAPKEDGRITASTIFRGETPGDAVGPYLSQFLIRAIPFGAYTNPQVMRTYRAGVDYCTDYASWLSVQQGRTPQIAMEFESTPRHLIAARDLARYVHVDGLYQAYLNACLILLGLNAKPDAGNPYNHLKNCCGFGTFAAPHILSLVTEVATRALKAAWFQKWWVHRRMRPEEFGGLVQNTMTGDFAAPLAGEILSSDAVQEVFSKQGSYLLPLAFAEGSPLHPAYTSGHATVAGACVTVLKAWFDEAALLPDAVVPSADGLSLVPYTGAALTVGGELNKIAANIASGRNFAGLHWRSDFTEGLKLGEAVALSILKEQSGCYAEPHSFTVTKFDGTTVTIIGGPR